MSFERVDPNVDGVSKECAGINKVRDLKFSDLYLGDHELGNRLTDVPGAPANPLRAGADLQQDLAAMLEACTQARLDSPVEDAFNLKHDDVKYRGTVMQTRGGEVFVLRKMAQKLPTFKELRVPTALVNALLEPGLSGLLLIAGRMNSGKTSTASAYVHEWLCINGGVAVTAEDPPELPLEGVHNTGVCYQTSVTKGYPHAAKRVMRLGAKLIYLGEIRDGVTAAEALRAGVNGHLVVSTIHADNLPNTLRRIQSLASESFDPSTANSLLADGLAGIIHQQLSDSPRVLNCSMLMVKKHLTVINHIRNGMFDQIPSDINMQMANLTQRVEK